jgi:serine/threonine-protein kinase
MYLSPEAIITPANIDARADLYALGAVGYFLLCGSPPFSGNTLAELCGHHLHTTPQRPSERRGAAIAEDLERIVLACLAKDALARPQSARELEEQLRGCRDAAVWSEGDAEQWWQHTSRPARPAPEPVREERRALCCADMNERLQRRRQHADAG